MKIVKTALGKKRLIITKNEWGKMEKNALIFDKKWRENRRLDKQDREGMRAQRAQMNGLAAYITGETEKLNKDKGDLELMKQNLIDLPTQIKRENNRIAKLEQQLEQHKGNLALMQGRMPGIMTFPTSTVTQPEAEVELEEVKPETKKTEKTTPKPIYDKNKETRYNVPGGGGAEDDVWGLPPSSPPQRNYKDVYSPARGKFIRDPKTNKLVPASKIERLKRQASLRPRSQKRSNREYIDIFV